MQSLLDEWIDGSGVPRFAPSRSAMDRLARLIERVPDFDGAGYLDRLVAAVEDMVVTPSFGRSHPAPERYARIVGPDVPDVLGLGAYARVDLGRIPIEGLPGAIAPADPSTRHVLAAFSLNRLGYRPGINGADPSDPHLAYPLANGRELRVPLLFSYEPERSVLRSGP